jgi:hypothetical protein
VLKERKQAKLQWLQNPGQINGDNLNNVKCGTCRTSTNKREYLKIKTMSFKQEEQK